VTSQTSIQRPQQVSVASSDPSALGLQATQHSARRTKHLLRPLCSVLLDLPSHYLEPARWLTLRLWTGLDAFPWMVSPTGARFTPRRNLSYHKKVKWSRCRPGVAQNVGKGIALLIHDRGTRRGWVVSTPAAIYPWERPGTHFTGSWVGSRAGLDGRKITFPPAFDPGPSSP